jgi:hypothetical protein
MYICSPCMHASLVLYIGGGFCESAQSRSGDEPQYHCHYLLERIPHVRVTRCRSNKEKECRQAGRQAGIRELVLFAWCLLVTPTSYYVVYVCIVCLLAPPPPGGGGAGGGGRGRGGGGGGAGAGAGWPEAGGPERGPGPCRPGQPLPRFKDTGPRDPACTRSRAPRGGRAALPASRDKNPRVGPAAGSLSGRGGLGGLGEGLRGGIGLRTSGLQAFQPERQCFRAVDRASAGVQGAGGPYQPREAPGG